MQLMCETAIIQKTLRKAPDLQIPALRGNLSWLLTELPRMKPPMTVCMPAGVSKPR